MDVETCRHCGGKVMIVASVEAPQTIRAVLERFEQHGVQKQSLPTGSARTARFLVIWATTHYKYLFSSALAIQGGSPEPARQPVLSPAIDRSRTRSHRNQG